MSEPHRGDLSRRPLARLLMDLYVDRFSGELRLCRDRVEKSFLFQKGQPFHAESSVPSEALSAQLVESGQIPRSAEPRIRTVMEREKCREATAVLSLGLLGSKPLVLALKERLRRLLVECFGWPDATFVLDAGAPLGDEGSQPMALHPYAVTQEGIESHWSPERVYRDLEGAMKFYPRATDGLARVAAHLRRDPAVELLLASLDGENSLWQVLQAACTPGALAAAWVLDATGAIEYTEQPGSRSRDLETAIEIVVARTAPAPPPEPARPAPTAARAAEDHSALAAEIDERFALIGETDCYALLGVAQRADAASIKKAYMQAARVYHPDVLSRAGLDVETRARGTRLFGEIAKAYARLSDPEQRRKYDASLEGGTEDLDVERLASAENLFLKGEVLLRQGNFRGALQFLEPAVELWPSEAAYQAALGWALFKKQPSEPERARAYLGRAVEIDAQDSQSLFRLGLVLRSVGETAGSEEAMDQARRIDPDVEG